MANVIAFVANDSVLHYLRAFVASLRRWMPDQRVIMIEYDDNCKIARKLASAYSIEVVSGACVDPMVSQLTSLIPNSAPGHFRKLQAFTLKQDTVVLIDVDMILLRDITPFYEQLKNENVALIYGERTLDWVYNENGRTLFPNSQLFSTGIVAFRPKLLSLDLIYTTIFTNCDEYNSVKNHFVHDQPLLNYIVDKNRLIAHSVGEYDHSISGSNYFLDEEMNEIWGEFPQVYKKGREVLMIHFAGLKDNPDRFRFREIWKFYDSCSKASDAALETDT